MALKINRVWKKWGVNLWAPFKRISIASWGNRSFEDAFGVAAQQIDRLRADMQPHPHHWNFGGRTEVPLVDVGFATVDVYMYLDGGSWVGRGVRFLTVSHEGYPIAHSMSRNMQVDIPVARIARGGDAFISLSPYLYDISGTAKSHYSRVRDALDELNGYLAEQIVFWSAFRHTA